MVSKKTFLMFIFLLAAACNHEITSGQLEEGPKPQNHLTVTGQVMLGEGVKTSGAGTLFVIARKKDQVGGPPLAVARLQNPVLPIGFTLSQKSVMIPTNVFEGDLRLSAKWSQGGSPMAVMPGDLMTGEDVIVPAGQNEVTLVLTQIVK